MSFLTTLPRERYDPHAFDRFDAAHRDFDLGNARAMAWACQLAYEAADDAAARAKIASIASDWSTTITDDGIVVEQVETVLPTSDTRFVFGVRGGAAVLAFAGTDPLTLADWITNFDVAPSAQGTAQGFTKAARSVSRRISDLLQGPVATMPIFVTGHSLGAALAVLTADELERRRPGSVAAVYTFGMPRAGDAGFASAYDALLGSRTYRLVHGSDLVATVPPSTLGAHHVGRLLQCARLGSFRPQDMAPVAGSDDPQFAAEAVRSIRSALRGPLSRVVAPAARARLAMALAFGMGPASMRTDPGGIAIELLPPPLRDHIPDRYIAATSPG